MQILNTQLVMVCLAKVSAGAAYGMAGGAGAYAGVAKPAAYGASMGASYGVPIWANYNDMSPRYIYIYGCVYFVPA
jgi:hypothetical protein